ncbi:hypothetical protein WJX75_001252 [Coccomyxa subellipsoidea]|uniref:BZIP domain-containing protein n=1 Tax=Coccomyxa subellipsoidea TaxID=248742 RepID=A0ABR2YD02_9CHLO
MKWTSDGSMMEELLKSLTPSTQQPATHNETALVKDASISSSLLALIAQQEEENVAAEGQASRDFHMAENETLPLRSNMNGATAHVKAEESGWLLDRGAPPLDGQVALSGDGGLYSSAGRNLSQGFPAASISSLAVVSTGSAPNIAAQDVRGMATAGTRSHDLLSIPILPSKLISGHGPSTFHGSPNYIVRRAIPQTQVNLANVSSPNTGFVGPNNSHADLTTQYMAVDGYAISTTGKQETLLNEGLLRSLPQGAMQQQSTSGQQASQSRIVSRPTILDGGLELQQGMCSTSSLPSRLYAGSVQEQHQGLESASLPPSASYQRPSSSHLPYQQPSIGSLHSNGSRKQLSSLDRDTDGNLQIQSLLGHVGRAASAPRERPRPEISELSARPRTPTEQGSDVRTYYAQPGELGSQLAAEYMREAAQTSAHTYMAPPTQCGPPPTYKPAAALDRTTMQMDSQPFGEIGSWGDTHMEDRDAKKQLRKEKNRASAAASRARREAYTASLEEEVAKLKEEKSWLEGQVNAPEHAMPMALPARAPIRFHGRAREELRHLAELLGIDYSGALIRDRTTHLILASEVLQSHEDIPRSQKLESAKTWGIALTRYAWLKDSLAEGKVLNAQKYIMQHSPSPSLSSLRGAHSGAWTPEQLRAANFPLAEQSDHLWSPGQASSGPADEAEQLSGHLIGTHLERQQQSSPGERVSNHSQFIKGSYVPSERLNEQIFLEEGGPMHTTPLSTLCSRICSASGESCTTSEGGDIYIEHGYLFDRQDLEQHPMGRVFLESCQIADTELVDSSGVYHSPATVIEGDFWLTSRRKAQLIEHNRAQGQNSLFFFCEKAWDRKTGRCICVSQHKLRSKQQFVRG